MDVIKNRYDEATNRIKNSTLLIEAQKRITQSRLDKSLNNAYLRLNAQHNLSKLVDRIADTLNDYVNQVANSRKILLDTISRDALNMNTIVRNMFNKATSVISDYQRKLNRT